MCNQLFLHNQVTIMPVISLAAPNVARSMASDDLLVCIFRFVTQCAGVQTCPAGSVTALSWLLQAEAERIRQQTGEAAPVIGAGPGWL